MGKKAFRVLPYGAFVRLADCCFGPIGMGACAPYAPSVALTRLRVGVNQAKAENKKGSPRKAALIKSIG